MVSAKTLIVIKLRQHQRIVQIVKRTIRRSWCTIPETLEALVATGGVQLAGQDRQRGKEERLSNLKNCRLRVQLTRRRFISSDEKVISSDALADFISRQIGELF